MAFLYYYEYKNIILFILVQIQMYEKCIAARVFHLYNSTVIVGRFYNSTKRQASRFEIRVILDTKKIVNFFFL